MTKAEAEQLAMRNFQRLLVNLRKQSQPLIFLSLPSTCRTSGASKNQDCLMKKGPLTIVTLVLLGLLGDVCT